MIGVRIGQRQRPGARHWRMARRPRAGGARSSGGAWTRGLALQPDDKQSMQNLAKFGSRLNRNRKPEWVPYYMDYKGIRTTMNDPDSDLQVVEATLSENVRRVSSFFAVAEEALVERRRDLDERIGSREYADMKNALSIDIVQLMEFANLNVDGFYKIAQLIKRSEKWSTMPMHTLKWLHLQSFFKCTSLQIQLRRIQQRSEQRARQQKLPRLIVFDKDGTLVTLVGVWGSWIELRVNRMAACVGALNESCSADNLAALRSELYKGVGYNAETKSLAGEGALLAYADPKTIEKRMYNILRGSEFIEDKAAEAIAAEAFEPTNFLEGKGKAELVAPGLLDTLLELRHRGVLIGCVTTDTMVSTQEDLEIIGLEKHIDVNHAVICGDDAEHTPKPNPAGLLAICKHYGVPPSDAWMVGDTRSDLLAARAAGFAVAVGVRTGVASDRELTGSPIPAASVDFMLETCADIVELLDARP